VTVPTSIVTSLYTDYTYIVTSRSFHKAGACPVVTSGKRAVLALES
jgi:hypothetical protein